MADTNVAGLWLNWLSSSDAAPELLALLMRRRNFLKSNFGRSSPSEHNAEHSVCTERGGRIQFVLPEATGAAPYGGVSPDPAPGLSVDTITQFEA